jgi:hypothetical protein
MKTIQIVRYHPMPSDAAGAVPASHGPDSRSPKRDVVDLVHGLAAGTRAICRREDLPWGAAVGYRR